jgi:hypothetical protein
LDKKDFIDPKNITSIFRGAKEIFIHQPEENLTDLKILSQRLETKIGLMGMGGHSKTEVIFERNQYYLGQTINVKVLCDNSMCGTPIKSFKIKLKRKVFVNGLREKEPQSIKTSKYLIQHKDVDHGCGPKSKCERNLTVEIPLKDPDFPEMIDSKLNEAELGLASQMQPSRNGHLWNVIYSVKIFVKHDSLTQRGEGECITLPIKVMAKPDESLNKHIDN